MLKVLVAALGLTALLVLPAAAKEQAVEAKDNGQIEFVMPSGNVGCLYTPAGGTDVYQPANGGPELICERIEPSYVTVILGAEGEAQMIEDPGEQSCCGIDNTFEYGNTITLDGFECESATTGLTCENDDGAGFSIAKAGVELFGPDEDDADDLTEDDDSLGGDETD